MHDWPTPPEILAAVADALRATGPLSPFERRVSAAALDIVRREIDQDQRGTGPALAGLRRIVGPEGEADGDLARALADAIRRGEIGEDTPMLMDYLWQVTLAKVAVDQPGFPLYRRLMEEEASR